MQPEVRQLSAEEIEDQDTSEEWVRESESELEVVGLDVLRGLTGIQVFINAAEFVRSCPLEDRLRAAMHSALVAVSGVTHVWEEDREVWHVDGEPSLGALANATARVLDDFEDEIRAHILGP